jgi:hypothetical protein
VNVAFDVTGLTEVVRTGEDQTGLLMSNGLQVGFYDDLVYLDFCPHTREPAGKEDFLKSDLMVAGKKCQLKVSHD